MRIPWYDIEPIPMLTGLLLALVITYMFVRIRHGYTLKQFFRKVLSR